MTPLTEKTESHSAVLAKGRVEHTGGLISLILTSMRPYQWVKNLFVLAPLLFGQQLGDPGAIGLAGLAFMTFCFMSSALYIVNDMTDAKADRIHPTKRDRPIASGTLSVQVALTAVAGLMVLAIGCASFIGMKFAVVAGVYFVVTFWYCLALKNVFLLDAMVIALGFVLRVSSGAVAIEVQVTHWLIVCTFLLALYLAFSKRRNELQILSGLAGEHRHVLSQYTEAYLEKVNVIIMAATIVCYALYTVAPETVAYFGTNSLIYGTVFVLYGLLRYMALTNNPDYGGDPTKLLLQDKPLWLSVLGWGIFNVVVIYRTSIVNLWNGLA